MRQAAVGGGAGATATSDTSPWTRAITDEERRLLRQLAAQKAVLEPTLRHTVVRLLEHLAGENRKSLSPRRYPAIADAAVTAFLAYLAEADPEGARESGRAMAREGVGVRPVLAAARAIRGETLQAVSDAPPIPALAALDRYFGEAFAGYLDELLERTLQNQEEVRRALSAALAQQSHELLIKNHAIDASRQGVMLTDLEGRVAYVNTAFVEMWGFRGGSEAVGMRMGDIVVELAEIGTGAGARLFQGEITAQRRDGRGDFDAEVATSVISDSDGMPAGLMASFADVTERKRMDARVRQAQKMDALGQLAGGIVHDFNNLLAAIGGYAQLLLMDPDDNAQRTEDLRQIKAATDRAKELTDQLRFFSRQVAARRRALDLNALVEETDRMLLRTFPREIAIRASLQPDLPSIWADGAQLSQLLVNLCLNARDAIVAAGGEGGVITIATQSVVLSEDEAARFVGARAGRYVRLHIADTGVGMTKKVRDRIFEPFFTTKEDSGGTGLGLALVYGIVRHHDGFVEVTSSPGQGAVFEVYFPGLEAPAEEGGAPIQGLVSGSGTVLVVDDEPQVLAMITRFLTRCGYSTLTASNGLEALAIYRERHAIIDLVVLDMVMPQMGGRKCLAELRAIDPATRVVCVSGFTADNSFEGLEREGSYAVMEKPLDFQRFSEIVAEATRRPRSQAS
jgi:two-component system, cell cycle sensor histidine kinase and response regulator CckA